MLSITVENSPTEDRLEQLGVAGWDYWTSEISLFPWFYEEEEVCYFHEGEVEVTPKGGEPVTMKAGDLVTFPKGMECMWRVLKPVKKQYIFF